MRAHLLDDQVLVRAVASGRQQGQEPRWKRVELRYVDLKAGRHLQVTAYDETQAHTVQPRRRRRGAGRGRRPARPAVRQLARRDHHRAAPGAGHQEARGDGAHQRPREAEVEVERGHDQRQGPAAARGRPGADGARHLRPAGPDQAEPAGEVPPGRGVPPAARQLDHRRARRRARCARPTVEDPLRIVDLGCGNAYLTFAAHRYLTHVRGLPVTVTGVDVKEQSRDHNGGVAAALGIADTPTSWSAPSAPRRWRRRPRWCSRCTPATPRPTRRWPGRSSGSRPLVLAAPVLPPRHRRAAAPQPHPRAVRPAHPARHPARAVRRHPDRRAAGVAAAGARATASTWSSSSRASTRRATRCSGRCAPAAPVKGGGVRKEYDELVEAWAVHPKLAELLGDRLA